MTDLERVIAGLEHCITDEPCCGQKYITCQYTPRETGDDCCARAFAKDVLALLKEQEAKTGHWIDTTNTIGFPRCKCSKCNSEAGASWMKYCPNCGAKMEGR